jgi:hypothetical protein
VTAGEVGRLAALERTLVGAAARQAERRKRRYRQLAVVAALSAPLLLVAAASVAATGSFAGVDRDLSTLRDDRLVVSPGSSSSLAGTFDARPRDRSSARIWGIHALRVAEYSTDDGSFCFVFGKLTGGCLQPGTLTAANPLDLTTDYRPKVFRVYGLAADGVRAISLRARGLTRRALVGRNAFYLEDDSLGGTRGFFATLTVNMRDGTTRHVRFVVGGEGTRHILPSFAGLAPAADTAA